MTGPRGMSRKLFPAYCPAECAFLWLPRMAMGRLNLTLQLTYYPTGILNRMDWPGLSLFFLAVLIRCYCARCKLVSCFSSSVGALSPGCQRRRVA